MSTLVSLPSREYEVSPSPLNPALAPSSSKLVRDDAYPVCPLIRSKNEADEAKEDAEDADADAEGACLGREILRFRMGIGGAGERLRVESAPMDF